MTHNNAHLTVGLVLWGSLASAFGLALNPQLADEGEKLYSCSLAHIETFWLKGDGPFLLGSSQPSIADLRLVCEIMLIEVQMHFLLRLGICTVLLIFMSFLSTLGSMLKPFKMLR